MELIQSFDNNLLDILNDFAQSSFVVKNISIVLAQYFIYIIPIALVILWFWPRFLNKNTDKSIVRKDLLFTFTLGVIGWQILSRIISLIYSRERPFQEIIGTKELIFHRPTYSFPSDHAIFLFTMAFTLISLKYLKFGQVLLILAILVSISRVMVAVHWPTDVIAGAILGYILSYFGILFQKQIHKNIIDPIYWLAKQVRLT